MSTEVTPPKNNGIVGRHIRRRKQLLLKDIIEKIRQNPANKIPDPSEALYMAYQINAIRTNLDFIIRCQESINGENENKGENSIKSLSFDQNSIESKNEHQMDKKVEEETLEEQQEQKYQLEKDRDKFLKDLYKFMEEEGQPILKPPKLGFQDLDLFKLYNSVVKRGGMDQVTRKQLWKEVYSELGIPTMSTSASYNTRTNYKKYLYLYELERESLIHGNVSSEYEEKLQSSEGEQTSSSTAFKFELKQYIKIESKLHDGQVFYAKILKRKEREGIPSYYVMYNGWTVSHNEWMPEYALQELSPEEKENPEKLVNPPAIRSSKSNYLIEEHLGISTSSKTELNKVDNERGDAAIILSSIADKKGHQTPLTPPPIKREGDDQILQWNITNLQRKKSNYHFATARPITPPTSSLIEFPHQNRITIASPINQQISNIKRRSRLATKISQHSNDNYILRKELQRTHHMSGNLSEPSRRKKAELTRMADLSQTEQAILEAETLHSLPPSNGRPNPPPISKQNLCQLATDFLMSISKIKNETEVNSEPFALPSKRLKLEHIPKIDNNSGEHFGDLTALRQKIEKTKMQLFSSLKQNIDDVEFDLLNHV